MIHGRFAGSRHDGGSLRLFVVRTECSFVLMTGREIDCATTGTWIAWLMFWRGISVEGEWEWETYREGK
jgi:hypothetical protein